MFHWLHFPIILMPVLLQVLYKEEAFHGSFLLDLQLRKRLMHEVQVMVQGARDKVAAALHNTSQYLVEPVVRKITGVVRGYR